MIMSAGLLAFGLLSSVSTQAENAPTVETREVAQPGAKSAQANQPSQTGINIPMGYFAAYGNQENPTSTAEVTAQQTQTNVAGQTPAPKGNPGTVAVKETNQVPSIPVLGQNANAATANAPANLNMDDASLPSHDAVDVASYQSWMTQNDFNILKAKGVKSVIVKISEGTWYTNPYAASQIQMARNAGLAVAVYHFLELGGSDTKNQAQANSDAIAEANYFMNTAKNLGIGASTPMILDCEFASVSSAINWTSAISTATNQLQANGYGTVRYYTSANWIGNGTINANGLGARNMWVAQYLYGSPSKNDLRNTQYGAWQFSSLMYFSGSSANRPVDTSIDYANIFGGGTSISAAASALPAGSTNVYRVYNKKTGEHFYTTSAGERNSLVSKGWRDEGTGWIAPTTSSTPVYRVYNSRAGDHFYTTSLGERNSLIKLGWRDEGIAFYSDDSKRVPLLRAYNPNAKAGSHNYTTSAAEQANLIANKWRDEGIAWYGIPAGSSSFNSGNTSSITPG